MHKTKEARKGSSQRKLAKKAKLGERPHQQKETYLISSSNSWPAWAASKSLQFEGAASSSRGQTRFSDLATKDALISLNTNKRDCRPKGSWHIWQPPCRGSFVWAERADNASIHNWHYPLVGKRDCTAKGWRQSGWYTPTDIRVSSCETSYILCRYDTFILLTILGIIPPTPRQTWISAHY